MDIETFGLIVAVTVGFFCYLIGDRVGFRRGRKQITHTIPAVASQPVPAAPSVVLCTLSGLPIQTCPPEHRHFPQPVRRLLPPQQPPQVARTPAKPATVPAPAPPKTATATAALPKRAPRPEKRGRHWRAATVHTQAMPTIPAVEEVS